MNKKSAGILFVLLMAYAVKCNINQDFMNGVKGLMGGGGGAGHLIEHCENHHYFYAWDFTRDQIDAFSDQIVDVTWLKGHHRRNMPDLLRKLKWIKKTTSVTFENHVNASGWSGVLAKALVATRVGDQIYARAGIGSATCYMKQQFNTLVNQVCSDCPRKCWDERKDVPRGINPHELMAVQDHLQQQSSQTMYDIGTARTGLGDHELENGLQSLYLQESHTLRRFFPEIQYDYTEMVEVPHHEIPIAVQQGSFGQIGDGSIFERIQQIAGGHDRSSFFHAPNHNMLFVISVNKSGGEFLIRMSSFKVDGRLPAGAFAWSVGGWNLERGGHGSSPSVHDLLSVFPALK